MIDIEIDNQKAKVPEGSTIIEAAQHIGTYIPHFCYHKKLSIAANCRMCLVEVEKSPKPVPACATPVNKGMKIFTRSKLALEAQKGVMEFLLINHPLDCPICDQGGECQLQDLSVGYGDSQSRYQEAKRVVFHKEVGPLISMQEMSRCIHCTRCVRFGQEVAGVMELGMVNRTMHAEITTFLGRSIDSELSGNMIDICPVGALTSKPFRYSARTWELQRRRSISPHDSLGTNLVIQIKHDRVMRVLPHENEAINECWISDKDRFSYEALNCDERLKQPMIKQDGEWQTVSWSAALDYVAHALKDIVKTSGPDQIAALSSPHSTFEELTLLKKLMSGLGSANIDSRPRQQDFSKNTQKQGVPWLGIYLSEINQLDAALVIGSFVRKDHPLIAQRLRRAANQSTQVSQLACTHDDSLIKLHANIGVSPKKISETLSCIIKAAAEITGHALPNELSALKLQPCDQSQKIAQSLCDTEKKHIFLGNVATNLKNANEIHFLTQTLAKITGSTFGFMGEAANSVGAHVAGANADTSEHAPFSKPRQAYILMSTEPELDCANPQEALSALQAAKTLIVLSAFACEQTKKYADVILPITPFTETSGTFINCEGRVQSFHGVVAPQGEARPGWKVLRVLGNLLQIPGFDYMSSEQIRDEQLGSLKNPDFVNGLDNNIQDIQLTLSEAQKDTTQPIKLQRIADTPIYSTDPIVRRAKALQGMTDAQAPTIRINSVLAEKLALKNADLAKVTQNGASVTLCITIDESVPEACVHLSSAHPETASLGGMFDSIDIERA